MSPPEPRDLEKLAARIADEQPVDWRALAQLPKRQQELIVMRMEFGMSYPEIAAEVDSTPDAVRVMVARAIVQLSRELGGDNA